MVQKPKRLSTFQTLSVVVALSALAGAAVSLSETMFQSYALVLVGGGLLLVLSALLLWFHKIETLLLLIAFFLPIEMVPGAEAINYPDLDLTTPLLLLALFYLGVLVLMTLRLRLLRTPLDLPILVFILVQVIIALLSPWPTETLIRYLKYDKVFILYYFFVNYLRTESRIQSVTKVYTLSAVVVALAGLAAFALFVVFGQPVWGVTFKWGYLPRIVGPTRDQNIFAAYMIPPLFLLFSSFLTAKGTRRRVLLLASLIAVGMAVLLTWSRSGILGLAVGAGCYGILNRKLLGRKAATVVAGGLAIVVVASIAATAIGYSPMMLIERFTGTAEGTAQSDDLHSNMANLAWQVFRQRPMGVGRDNLVRYLDLTSPDLQRAFDQKYGITAQSYQAFPVHSSWLEILVSEGLFGFGAFLAIVWLTLRAGLRARRWLQGQRLSFVLNDLIAGFCGILTAALFYTFDWMYFPWFIIAMIVVIAMHAQRKAQHRA